MKKFFGFIVLPLVTLFVIAAVVVYLKENLAPDDSGAAVGSAYTIAGSVTCLTNPAAVANQAFEIAVTSNGITNTNTVFTDSTGKYTLELTPRSGREPEGFNFGQNNLGTTEGNPGCFESCEDIEVCASGLICSHNPTGNAPQWWCTGPACYPTPAPTSPPLSCGDPCSSNTQCSSGLSCTFSHPLGGGSKRCWGTWCQTPTKLPCFATCMASLECQSNNCGHYCGSGQTNCCGGAYCTGNPTPTSGQGAPIPTQGNGGGTSTPSRTPSPTPTRTPVPSPTPSPFPAPTSLGVTCSTSGLAKFTWNGNAPKFILRVNHDPSNVTQCTNTTNGAQVGWFCGPANCSTCDDRYTYVTKNSTTANPTNSHELQLTAGQRYIWSIQSVAANGTPGGGAGSIEPGTASFVCGTATGPSNTPQPTVAPTSTALGKVEIKYVTPGSTGITPVATNCGLPVGLASGECGPNRSYYKNYNLTRPGNYTTFDFTLSSCPQASITPTVASTATPTEVNNPTAVPSSTPSEVPECAPLDVNADSKLDLVDFAAFAGKYSQPCRLAQNRGPELTCGYTDTNGDGKVNIVDLAAFASKYYLRTPRCDQ